MQKAIILAIILLINPSSFASKHDSLKSALLTLGLIDQKTLNENIRTYKNMAHDFALRSSQKNISVSNKKKNLLKIIHNARSRLNAQLESTPGLSLLPSEFASSIAGVDQKLESIRTLVLNGQIKQANTLVQAEVRDL